MRKKAYKNSKKYLRTEELPSQYATAWEEKQRVPVDNSDMKRLPILNNNKYNKFYFYKIFKMYERERERITQF